MSMEINIAIGITLLSLCLLLVVLRKRSRVGAALFKPLASCGFLAVGYFAGVLATPHGQLVLLALILSWFGDVFLLSQKKGWFMAGLVSFLLGHVAYVAAFIVRGADLVYALLALGLLLLPGALVFRLLAPHLGSMKGPVIAYMIVISLMVASATGTMVANGGVWILIGAVLFYLSDLFVARDRFVAQTYINRLVGLPLYYGGQLILAIAAC